MAPVYPSFKLEFALGGVGVFDPLIFDDAIFDTTGGYVDVRADVKNDPIVCEYGIREYGPTARVASTGSLSFVLNNSEYNSGAMLGYYAPLSVNKRATFDFNLETRFVLSHPSISAGAPYYKFRGHLADITPEPWKYGPRRTFCTATDIWDAYANLKLPDLPPQPDQRADQLLTTIVDALVEKPAARSFDTGISTFEWSLDGGSGQNLSVREQIYMIVLSEFGYCYTKGDTVQGGTMRFENRHYRPTHATSVCDLVNDMTPEGGMVISGSRDDLANVVQVFVHPTRVGTGANTVLFALQTTTTLIGASDTLDTIFGPYRDPDTNEQVGGTNMVQPVPTVDFTMNAAADGSGADLTANFTVNASFTGMGVRFTIVNTAATPAYLTKLQARGDGIYRYEAMIEADVVGSFGNRVLSSAIDMPYQSDLALASDLAAYLAAVQATGYPRVRSVTFLANTSLALLTQALAREPGDAITVTETASGLGTSVESGSDTVAGVKFYINGVRLELQAGGILWCTWYLDATYTAQQALLAAI